MSLGSQNNGQFSDRLCFNRLVVSGLCKSEKHFPMETMLVCVCRSFCISFIYPNGIF